MELRHARIGLKLHTLQPGEGSALLLLHALGGSADDWDAPALGWKGPVHALDLSGHGHSGRLHGGAYHPSLWAADADVALEALGGATLVGAGSSAYAALLLAGARPEQVPAAVLLPGPGLSGFAPEPRWDAPWPFGDELEIMRTSAIEREVRGEAGCDPGVGFGNMDLRPPDYSDGFARAARRVVLLDDAAPKPPWWESLRRLDGGGRVERRTDSLADVLDGLDGLDGLDATA